MQSPKKHIAHQVTRGGDPCAIRRITISEAELALLAVVGLLFLAAFFLGGLFVVRRGLAKQGGRPNDQRQTKHQTHQCLHSGLLKFLRQFCLTTVS